MSSHNNQSAQVLPAEFLREARNVGFVSYNLDYLDTNPPTHHTQKFNHSVFESEQNAPFRNDSGVSGLTFESNEENQKHPSEP